MPVVLVRGAGEFGSAIAHRCFLDGIPVVLHDSASPDACHRWMAFADAIFAGRAVLDGLTATRVDRLDTLTAVLEQRAAIPVTTSELAAVLAALRPDLLVDARMRKRERPEPQIGLAPVTVGVGPNFVAGETTDLIVETGFGEDFARVSDSGATRPLSGEPPSVLGHGRDRFLYAPVAGLFRTSLQIGDCVQADQEVACIDTLPLLAPFSGALRGLTHDGVPVVAGTRLVEVDPRGPEAVTRGIGPRQARIAQAVLAVIEDRFNGGLNA